MITLCTHFALHPNLAGFSWQEPITRYILEEKSHFERFYIN